MKQVWQNPDSCWITHPDRGGRYFLYYFFPNFCLFQIFFLITKIVQTSKIEIFWTIQPDPCIPME